MFIDLKEIKYFLEHKTSNDQNMTVSTLLGPLSLYSSLSISLDIKSGLLLATTAA